MDDPASVIVRFALYVDLMLLMGLPTFGLYALRGAERVSGSVLPFRRLIGLLALAGVALSALALMMMAAAMSGAPLTDVDRDSVDALATGTSIGSAWQVRTVALLGAIWLALMGWRKPRTGLIFASAAGAIALASLAWTGHGAATEGVVGSVHLIGDIIHLLAAGIWIGALFALALLLFRRAAAMTAEHVLLSHRTLEGFSVVGSVVVGLVIVSGLSNSWILIGPKNLPALFTTLYGQLLIAKLVLLAAMLGLAWANRFRLTPALAAAIDAGDHDRAVGALRRSLILETAAALVILLLVAWLGLLAPSGSNM